MSAIVWLCSGIPVILLPLALLIAGCHNANHNEEALLALFQKEKDLHCQLAVMKDSIRMEWDHVSEMLDENLPEDMPEEEKNNMLKVRNASLIRMFQSYDDVDDQVKMALDKTEMLDRDMSQRINLVRQELQKTETETMQLFQKIGESKSSDELARLKDIQKNLLAENCL